MTTLFDEVTEVTTEVIDVITHDVEELFPPKPGGLVDRFRKRRAEEEAAQEAGATSEVESLGRNKVRAVRTADQSSEIASATTIVINATTNPVQRILGRDPNRKRAVIMALDAPVILTYSLAAASDPQNAANGPGLRASGFVLPVGMSYTIQHQGEVYAIAPATAYGPPVGVASSAAYGSAAAPGAFGNVVSVSNLAAGIYNVSWTVSLEGTVSASDIDNFRLVASSVLITRSVNPGAVGAYVQGQAQVNVTSGGAVLVQSNGAATAGSTYAAQLICTPVSLVAGNARVSVSTEVYDPE